MHENLFKSLQKSDTKQMIKLIYYNNYRIKENPINSQNGKQQKSEKREKR